MIPVALLLALALFQPPAFAADLSGLLERGGDASYGAEQVVNCATPDGVSTAVLTIEQSGGDLLVGSGIDSETSISIGAGGWAMTRRDGIVDQANVTGNDSSIPDPYSVTELGGVTFLGREATAFRLERDGLVRAELVLDDLTGVVVRSATFDSEGAPYCTHRFISFDPGVRQIPKNATQDVPALDPLESASGVFPEQIAGFARLDEYEDAGIRFTYYSDGFFSFAVFHTPAIVALPEPVEVRHALGEYQRAFTPGQVFYSWEISDGGMAMVGDLPPDMYEAVLGDLPKPERPGLFRRLWRSIFGFSSAGRLE